MNTRDDPGPAGEPPAGDKSEIVQLTEGFISDVDDRLRHLERQLWARWLMTFATLLASAVVFTLLLGRITTSRQKAINASCIVSGAIAQQGRAVIRGQIETTSTPFERSLERLGYPPVKARQKAAETAARQYVIGIAQRIESQLGHKGDGLINRDGTINCRVLANLSGTRSP